MSTTTIVFACKSNSCRSQMAEAWAREWIKIQRAELMLLPGRDGGGDGGGRDDDGDDEHKDYDRDENEYENENERIRAFLDGIYVASVALDESTAAAASSHRHHQEQRRGEQQHQRSESSSLTTMGCVTCDGEEDVCAASVVAPLRRPPKEKAIIAMAQDGVDISDVSTYYAKSFMEVLPSVIVHRRRSLSRRRRGEYGGVRARDGSRWERGAGGRGPPYPTSPKASLFRRILENASREMGLAFAGIPRDVDVVSDDDENDKNDDDENYILSDDILLDNFIVLCSCPDSIVKRRLAGVSATTLEWDIDPPSACARGNEGDGAYLRVSRQIRGNVHRLMDGLKGRAISACGTATTTTSTRTKTSLEGA
jgi:hypothetical protein